MLLLKGRSKLLHSTESSSRAAYFERRRIRSIEGNAIRQQKEDGNDQNTQHNQYNYFIGRWEFHGIPPAYCYPRNSRNLFILISLTKPTNSSTRKGLYRQVYKRPLRWLIFGSST